MRIIFQPLRLFPRLGKYFQFLYKKKKEMNRKEKERKLNKLYVSWLPLANKSILSQGDIASLYVVFVMLTSFGSLKNWAISVLCIHVLCRPIMAGF